MYRVTLVCVCVSAARCHACLCRFRTVSQHVDNWMETIFLGENWGQLTSLGDPAGLDKLVRITHVVARLTARAQTCKEKKHTSNN